MAQHSFRSYEPMKSVSKECGGEEGRSSHRARV